MFSILKTDLSVVWVCWLIWQIDMGLSKPWNTQAEYYRLVKNFLQALKVKQQHSWNPFFEPFQTQIPLKCLWLPLKSKKLLSAWVFDLKIWSKHRMSMLLISANTLRSKQALEHMDWVSVTYQNVFKKSQSQATIFVKSISWALFG